MSSEPINKNDWEEVANLSNAEPGECLRLRVPGGWLYLLYSKLGNQMVFVPDLSQDKS